MNNQLKQLKYKQIQWVSKNSKSHHYTIIGWYEYIYMGNLLVIHQPELRPNVSLLNHVKKELLKLAVVVCAAINMCIWLYIMCM